ncbi:hypothetical protein GQX73_g659 [Xylaria multiplex]|uniref:Receptor L-domain domain-containing protein n=1 Tax=Xylaria multiplex TaxID=323545 RepID=A0A7C8IZK9_9PEZI|nr:hypothetical protein GQX73_g659 [Xylaria multiplex]
MAAIPWFRFAKYIYCRFHITRFGGFTLENAAFINTVDSVDPNNEPTIPVEITESMLLQNSFVDDNSLKGGTEIPLRRIGTITQDLNITSNGNVHIAYDGLTDVGGSLYIEDNWNCSINFDKLSTVGNIFFANNTNTGLPLFPNLTTVGNIYISGFIGTSNGPNIFPALELVSGNVIINATNDAFDCSKLVSQLNNNKIHNLNCNGRNYNVDASTPGLGNGSGNESGSKSSPGLSGGIWAGIGVGTGAAVLGILGAFIWLIMRYRSRVRKLEKEAAARASEKKSPTEEKSSTEEAQQPQVFWMQEVDGRGIFREKPDDPLVEMPTYPTELPSRPQSWARSEAEVISWAR